MVAYNVMVMKNVSTCLLLSVGGEVTQVSQDAHFCDNMLPISLAYPLNIEFLVHKYLQETAVSLGT